MPLRLLHTIAVGHRIDDVAINRDGTTLYAPVHWDQRVDILDLPTGGIGGHIDLPGRPNGVTVSPDGRTAIVTATQRGARRRSRQGVRSRSAHQPDHRHAAPRSHAHIGRLQPRRHARLRLHLRPGGVRRWQPLCLPDRGLAVDRDGIRRRVGPNGRRQPGRQPSVCVMQIRQGQPRRRRLDSNELSGYVTGMGGDPNGIAVNPNGILVYVSALSDGYVNIVDTNTGTSTEWIDVGFEPHHLVLNEYRAELYVAHNRQLTVPSQKGLVIVVDLHTHQILQRVEIDAGAGGMASATTARGCTASPMNRSTCSHSIDLPRRATDQLAAFGGRHRGTERRAEPERVHERRDGAAVPGRAFGWEPLGVRAHRRHRPAHLRLPTVLRASRRPVRGAPRSRSSERVGLARVLDRVFALCPARSGSTSRSTSPSSRSACDDSGHLQPHRRHPIREGTAGSRWLSRSPARRSSAPSAHLRSTRSTGVTAGGSAASPSPSSSAPSARRHCVDTGGGPDGQTCPRRT